MKYKNFEAIGCGIGMGLLTTTAWTAELGTAFTYQGQLKNGGSPFNGSALMTFELYDALTGGNLVGTDNAGSVTVADGLFTVEIDFGADPYTLNEARWLQVTVSDTPLTPRQRLTAAPFSLGTRGINVDGEGNVEGSAGVAFGNEGNVGLGKPGTLWNTYDALFDFSATISDFSANEEWTPFRAIIHVDPSTDLTNSGIYAHDFETYVPPTNDKYISYLQGPYMGALHQGTGDTDLLAGALSIALSRGNVNNQVGHSAQSVATGGGSLTTNTGLEVLTGHYGFDGDVGENFGIHVWTPWNDRPIGTNYGIYIQDQDVGTDASYALYAAGGDTYLNGNVTGTGQCAFGNLATFDLGAPYYPETERNFEFADRISDFSTAKYWSMFSAYLVADPDVDMINGEYVEGLTGGTIIPVESDKDIFYTSGATFGTELHGAGDFKLVSGTNGYTYTLGSANVEYLTSLSATSAILPDSTSIVDNLSGLDVFLGQNSPAATVDTSTGIRVYSPYYLGPVTTHYGIRLEDQNSSAGTNYAIYSAGGDVYFNGDLEVTGNISKGGGSFKIDHPLDPENKYLYHSFIESPDMMNVYNGNITTDDEGFAIVTMPEYFEALNRDFRYQLTVIGQFAQAIVAEKIHDNRFVIQTDAPRVEVSWQVTGIRQDAFANENRIPVEVEKSDTERGKYLHPAAFGQPNERRIGWKETPSRPMDRMRAGQAHPTVTKDGNATVDVAERTH